MTEKLTINDCVAVGLCASGARRRCIELGLNDRQFFREGGLPLELMRRVEDDDVRRAVAAADIRIAKRGIE